MCSFSYHCFFFDYFHQSTNSTFSIVSPILQYTLKYWVVGVAERWQRRFFLSNPWMNKKTYWLHPQGSSSQPMGIPARRPWPEDQNELWSQPPLPSGSNYSFVGPTTWSSLNGPLKASIDVNIKNKSCFGLYRQSSQSTPEFQFTPHDVFEEAFSGLKVNHSHIVDRNLVKTKLEQVKMFGFWSTYNWELRSQLVHNLVISLHSSHAVYSPGLKCDDPYNTVIHLQEINTTFPITLKPYIIQDVGVSPWDVLNAS